jgi:hypothetical protein
VLHVVGFQDSLHKAIRPQTLEDLAEGTSSHGERKLLDFLHDDSVECNVIESIEGLYDT